MKAAIKAQWVKDLRSGEFGRGQSYLERVEEVGGEHKFCCLGVLCRQAVKAGVTPEPELHGDVYRYLDDEYDDDGNVTGEAFVQTGSLPRKVALWAGVEAAEGDIFLNPEQSLHGLTAVEANDIDDLSFAEIADLIEANVPAE